VFQLPQGKTTVRRAAMCRCIPTVVLSVAPRTGCYGSSHELRLLLPTLPVPLFAFLVFIAAHPISLPERWVPITQLRVPNSSFLICIGNPNTPICLCSILQNIDWNIPNGDLAVYAPKLHQHSSLLCWQQPCKHNRLTRNNRQNKRVCRSEERHTRTFIMIPPV